MHRQFSCLYLIFNVISHIRSRISSNIFQVRLNDMPLHCSVNSKYFSKVFFGYVRITYGKHGKILEIEMRLHFWIFFIYVTPSSGNCTKLALQIFWRINLNINYLINIITWHLNTLLKQKNIKWKYCTKILLVT